MRQSQSGITTCLALLLTLSGSADALADTDYSISDGAAELAISIDPGEAMVWMNTFPVDPGGGFIHRIRVAYGRVGGPSALNNLPVRILLYEDTNGGSPQDAVLKWSFLTTIRNANTNVLNTYNLPALPIQGNLVVGALFMNNTAVLKGIGALDTTAPSLGNRSYVGFAASIDPANLAAIPVGQWGTIESFGPVGNFRIEAHGLATVDDDEVTLVVGQSKALGLVQLSWSGGQPAYEVDRASTPDFSDGQVLAPAVFGSTYDDETLADGQTWFYRVR